MTNNIRSSQLNILAMLLLTGSSSTYAAPQVLSQSPLFVANGEKANVLVVIDNSNSMDENAAGAAAGSASADSKSEIARNAVENIITNYTGKINMGLMAYQQTGTVLRNIHNSAYDASFDSNNFNVNFGGARDSQTKRFEIPNNSVTPAKSIYYNVNLPYYSNGNDGNAFCYSRTADFDNGAETYPGGPWDTYRCFRNKTTETDPNPNTIWGNSGLEAAAGFTNYFNTYTFSPTDSDIAQGILDFGTFLTWNWVSETWFANSSPGRGYLHTPILNLDTAHATLLNTKLATSQFAVNAPTDPSRPLQNAGHTPLEGTLLTAKDYFEGTTLPADEGGPAATVPESCGKDFVALLTDGLPSTEENGTTITNTTTALADVATAAGALKTAGVETYTIGFALPVGTDPTALDSIAAAGGTNTSFLASDSATLQATFDTIFTDILAKTGASSSAATNSTSLSSNSVIYQARFNSGDWRGELLARPISLSGTISSTASWNAATQLDAKSATSRVILTYGRDSSDGIPFRWTDLSAQVDTTAADALNTDPISLTTDGLGSDRVDFLRGGTGGTSAALFRSDRNGKLGDIVHSTPYYVGIPSAGYNDIEMPGYATFRTANKTRQPVLYTGANDGMLHGFDTSTGDELLAYVPRAVFPNLNLLTAQGYGTTVPHHYFVDGAPMVADADVNGWKTILAGGLNGGGQGIYALDVTDPTTFAESAAASTVLWEFTDEDDADLGFTYIQPADNLLTNQSAQIAKMANGEWAVIIGNGYNNTDADGNASTTGHASLFILFIEEGIDGSWATSGDYKKIDTGEGSTTTPNGLATPAPVDTDGDGDIDVVYAGDLEGNMWRFDVSNLSSPSSDILFTAKDSSNNPQPITSAPLVTRHPNTGYMIGFATGKYLELSDISTTATQTIYGIWDQGSMVTNRSKLVEQTVIDTQTIGSNRFRVTSTEPVDYTSTKKGWFMDLPESGERVDLNPVIRDGRFVFVTRTPSSAPCVAGGTSWLMELDYLSGGRLDVSPFDVNGDGIINSLDYVTITINSVETQVPVSGYQSGSGGMISTPTILKTDTEDEELKILSNSDGQVEAKLESVNTKYKGRVSWEEIR